MKTTFRLFIILIIILIASSCAISRKAVSPGQVIAPLSDTVTFREGTLIYSLPMTVFTISFEMERTIELPGPYAKYAGELLGIADAIMNEDERWTISGVSVNSHEEADPSEFYVIETNTLFTANALSLKREGLILDVSSGINPDAAYSIHDKEINVDQFRSFDLGSDEYYIIDSDTAYRRVRVDDQFIRLPYLVETKKKLTESQLAEKAARRLMDLRDGKLLILTGEANVFPQSEAAINEMNRMEKEYTELFTGKTITENKRFTFQITPGKEMAGKPVVLFKFSEVTGPEEASSEAGTAVNVILNPEQKTKEVSVITRQESDPLAPKVDKIYYRMPDVVKMTIIMGDETLYSSRKLVCQFGEILQLPANYIIGK
jgi:hypothetical protein